MRTWARPGRPDYPLAAAVRALAPPAAVLPGSGVVAAGVGAPVRLGVSCVRVGVGTDVRVGVGAGVWVEVGAGVLVGVWVGVAAGEVERPLAAELGGTSLVAVVAALGGGTAAPGAVAPVDCCRGTGSGDVAGTSPAGPPGGGDWLLVVGPDGAGGLGVLVTPG